MKRSRPAKSKSDLKKALTDMTVFCNMFLDKPLMPAKRVRM